MTTKKKSEEKKQSLIDTRKRHPDLPLSIIAKQHAVSTSIAYRWWNEYQKNLEQKK